MDSIHSKSSFKLILISLALILTTFLLGVWQLQRLQWKNSLIINFDEFEDEEFPYGMKQPPSLNNPLGQVKFMLPNRHNIYLHDTPSKHLFLEEERAFSHGCVRVHEPFKLAYEILKDNIEDPSSVLNDLLENTKEYKLTLKDDIPVHLVYLTAWSDNGDDVSYRKDIYRRDSEIYQSLENIKQTLMIK